jgi:hypothetical protein
LISSFIIDAPALGEERFQRAVKAGNRIPTLAGRGVNLIAALYPLGLLGPK